MPEPAPHSPNTRPRPVASIAEAEQLIGQFGDAIDSLVAVLEEETTLIRNGRLRETPRLNASKAELARRYVADAAQVRANSAFISHHVQGKLADMYSTMSACKAYVYAVGRACDVAKTPDAARALRKDAAGAVLFAGEKATDNPFNSKVYDWMTSSPPPTHNFEGQPEFPEEPHLYIPKPSPEAQHAV